MLGTGGSESADPMSWAGRVGPRQPLDGRLAALWALYLCMVAAGDAVGAGSPRCHRAVAACHLRALWGRGAGWASGAGIDETKTRDTWGTRKAFFPVRIGVH